MRTEADIKIRIAEYKEADRINFDKFGCTDWDFHIQELEWVLNEQKEQ